MPIEVKIGAGYRQVIFDVLSGEVLVRHTALADRVPASNGEEDGPH